MMTISNDIGIYDVINPKIKEKIFPELGNSQITEPDIILPISNVNDLSNSNNYTYTENGSTVIASGNSSSGTTSGNSSSGTTLGNSYSETTPNNTLESSATTDETKTYVSGGTTPDSQIVVKKPTTKYFVYGIVGIVIAYLGYKVFLKKDSV